MRGWVMCWIEQLVLIACCDAWEAAQRRLRLWRMMTWRHEVDGAGMVLSHHARCSATTLKEDRAFLVPWLQ